MREALEEEPGGERKAKTENVVCRISLIPVQNQSALTSPLLQWKFDRNVFAFCNSASACNAYSYQTTELAEKLRQ